VEALRRRDPDVLEALAARCCAIKAEIVAIDERDRGVRAVLNFGHTLGHAIEQASGYERWLHGEAVAMGMLYAAELSRREQGFPSEDAGRLKALLGALGLPAHPGAEGFAGGWAALRAAFDTDKKKRAGLPRFVLARKLGAVVFDHAVGDDVLADAFRAAFPPAV
jgi:3-dehydroquinate synthase